MASCEEGKKNMVSVSFNENQIKSNLLNNKGL